MFVAIPVGLAIDIAVVFGFFHLWCQVLSVFIPERLAIKLTIGVIFFGFIFLTCSIGALSISAMIEPHEYWAACKFDISTTTNYMGTHSPAWHMLFIPIVFALDILKNFLVNLPHLFNGAFFCWYAVGAVIAAPFAVAFEG